MRVECNFANPEIASNQTCAKSKVGTSRGCGGHVPSNPEFESFEWKSHEESSKIRLHFGALLLEVAVLIKA